MLAVTSEAVMRPYLPLILAPALGLVVAAGYAFARPPFALTTFLVVFLVATVAAFILIETVQGDS